MKIKLDRCFQKQKQSCLPHMSVDGNKWVLQEDEIINYGYQRKWWSFSSYF